MVKAPTKHGLDRKFKPWRRGKSEKSNKRTSLKQQLRGIERLLQKLPETDTERRQELQAKVKSLQAEIANRQSVLLEKKHAEKAHGQRFLDRQRLTRQEKHAQKEKDEQTLLKIALDQIYVAHHPNDIKYMPLFRKGQRVVDLSRQLYRRAVTRKRILKDLATTNTQRVSWISSEQYKRLPSEWSIEDEERIFGGSISRSAVKEQKQQKLAQASADSRFALAPTHDMVLHAADQIDAELDVDDEIGDDKAGGQNRSSDESSSDESDEEKEEQTHSVPRKDAISAPAKGVEDEVDSTSESDSDDDADPLKRNVHPTKESDVVEKDDSSDSSSDDSSDDSSVNEEAKQTVGAKIEKFDVSSDSSDDSSDSSDDENEEKSAKIPPRAAKPIASSKIPDEEEEEDDFLVDAQDDDDDKNVFSMTLKRVPALDNVRGDKSKGWETQRQRPGQFKKRRVRR